MGSGQLTPINCDIKNLKNLKNSIKGSEIVINLSGLLTEVKNNDFIIQDFKQHKIKNIINLFGIESPGLTSSMSIGEYVSNIAEKTLNG